MVNEPESGTPTDWKVVVDSIDSKEVLYTA